MTRANTSEKAVLLNSEGKRSRDAPETALGKRGSLEKLMANTSKDLVTQDPHHSQVVQPSHSRCTGGREDAGKLSDRCSSPGGMWMVLAKQWSPDVQGACCRSFWPTTYLAS